MVEPTIVVIEKILFNYLTRLKSDRIMGIVEKKKFNNWQRSKK
jgi:hypothetical protein